MPLSSIGIGTGKGGYKGDLCPPQAFIKCYMNFSLLYVQFQTVPPNSKGLSYAYVQFLIAYTTQKWRRTAWEI